MSPTKPPYTTPYIPLPSLHPIMYTTQQHLPPRQRRSNPATNIANTMSSDEHPHASAAASDTQKPLCYFKDDEAPDHDKRNKSTLKVAYPFLGEKKNAGERRDNNSRPNTASQSKYPGEICDAFNELKINNAVKRRGGDDQGDSLLTESEIVGDRFDSQRGQVAAATLHIMDAGNLEGCSNRH